MALLDLGVLTALLATHLLKRLGAKALAAASIAMLVLLASTIVALFVDQGHG